MEAAASAAKEPSTLERISVLIPARRAEPALAPLVDELIDAGIGTIILVDDGSPRADEDTFNSLARRPRVRVLRHAVNLGKGRALKTGINDFLTSVPVLAGLVTADADGQHTAIDIVRVAQALLAGHGRPVLGSRDFGGGVPLRSRIGNSLTRLIFHFVSGHRVRDTQTGLRGFPSALLPELLALPGERYEYEMTALAHLCRQGNSPLEVPVSTIYIDNNRSSHFNPMRDSMRIYFVLVRFYASSLISAGLDLAGFSLAFWLTHNVLIAVAAGRLNSLINFALNRSLVFHNRMSIKDALWRYYLLALVLAVISYSFIRGLSGWLGWNMIAIKILVETTLSLVSFSVQRTFVFGEGANSPRDL
jgi:glycosyltransferase involved in cell wall biosynthesis